MNRRVFFFAPFLGVNTWRSEWPALDLQRRGYDARLVDKYSPPGLRERLEQVLKPSDVVILHVSNMVASGLTSFVQTIKPRVAHLILSFDDDYFTHEDVQIRAPEGLIGELHETIPYVSGLVCATDGVADAYRNLAGGFVQVIPNRMPQAIGKLRWTGAHRRVVAYMAALGPMLGPEHAVVDPHYLDAYSVADDLGDVPLIVIGGSDATPEALPHARWRYPLYPDVRWPRRERGKLYREIAKFRVAIAPLRDTRWNHAKSWIKPLEFATVGVPCVTSDVAEYRRLQSCGVGTWIVPRAQPELWRTWLDVFLGMSETHWRAVSNDLHAEAAGLAIERHDEWEKLVCGL